MLFVFVSSFVFFFWFSPTNTWQVSATVATPVPLSPAFSLHILLWLRSASKWLRFAMRDLRKVTSADMRHARCSAGEEIHSLVMSGTWGFCLCLVWFSSMKCQSRYCLASAPLGLSARSRHFRRPGCANNPERWHWDSFHRLRQSSHECVLQGP